MTQDVDIFQEQDQTIPDNVDPFEALVGEGKKFKTKEDLAKGKLQSDGFIKQLQTELSGLREELNGKIKLEAFLDKLEKTPSPPQNVSPPGTLPEEKQPNGNSLTEEDINRLLSQREQQTTEKANLTRVAEELRKKYGDNFQHVVNAKAKELDLGKEYLEAVARQRPTAFLKLLDAIPDKQEETSTNPTGNVNTQGFKRTDSTMKKFSDYSKLRRSDPTAYWKPAVQNELARLTKEYGPAFLKS